MKKRILCFVVAIMMCSTMFSISSFAATNEKQTIKEDVGELKLASIEDAGVPLVEEQAEKVSRSSARASYPVIIANIVYGSVGENVPIVMTYLPAYTNEKIKCEIVDANGKKVGETTFDCYNTSTIKYLTLTWDTKNKKSGVYYLVITKYFYSYYQWNQAPTQSKYLISLFDDIPGIFGDNKYTGAEDTFSCVQEGSQVAVKNTMYSGMSAWKKTEFPKYDIVLSELYMDSAANAIVQEENMFNAKENTYNHWYLMKFDITNKGEESLDASSVLKTTSFHKYTGLMMYVANTATISNRPNYSSATIESGETAEVWMGILVPRNQQVPFLVIDGTYLNINPQYAATPNTKLRRRYQVSNVKLSTTNYTYDGKTKTPSVTVKDASGKKLTNGKDYTVKYASGRKNVGSYKVSVTFLGDYYGTKTVSFNINPKGTSISKVSKGTKAFTVKWKKQSAQISGYQIQYSTSSKFKSGNKTVTVSGTKKTSQAIKKLKAKKKYYVRIRTYRTVQGKKYYSSWSSVKSVKTK